MTRIFGGSVATLDSRNDQFSVGCWVASRSSEAVSEALEDEESPNTDSVAQALGTEPWAWRTLPAPIPCCQEAGKGG